MRFVALFVLASACGAPAAAPITNHPTTSAPSSPAPTLAVTDQFQLSRPFPEIAASGTVVVLALEDNDGGRGYPNLRFVVKDRGDAILETHVVLAADEADGYLGEPELVKKLAPRIARANAWLAAQHAKYDLTPMPIFEVIEGEDGYGDAKRAVHDNLAVTWDTGTLEIRAAAGLLFGMKVPNSWLAKPHSCDGCDPCVNPAFLGGAAVDATHRLAVITVSYTGTDTCWEPPDQQRVVTW